MIRYNPFTDTYAKISYINYKNKWLRIEEPTERPYAGPHPWHKKKKEEKTEICPCCYMIKSSNGTCGCEEQQ